MPPLNFEYEEIAGRFYPIVPVELVSSEKNILTRAYVDSGATFSIFNSEIAEYLGIDYLKGEKIFPAGIGGHICAYLNDIILVVGGMEIPCKVLFSEEFVIKFNLVGRAGVFDKFKVCFDDAERVVE
ncbi:MAG: hypothetical protein ACE5J5_07480, partial [Candidatus Hydrothermarchaeales archaeon]